MKIDKSKESKLIQWIPPWSSITGRLIILHLIATFVMLLLATTFLYWMRATDFQEENRLLLEDEILMLRLIFRELTDAPATLDAAVRLDRDKLRIANYYHRILNNGNAILLETPGMAPSLPVSSFPPPLGIHESPENAETVKVKLRNGNSYLLMAGWSEIGSTRNQRLLLQVALEVSRSEILLAKLSRWLLFVFIFGMVFSAGASFAVARGGLRPLGKMAKAAQRIKVTHLHERIGAKMWPEELKTLASAFDEMLNRLEDSFMRLSQFSADLAHELRTPINNLMGEAELALYKKRSPDELRTILESSLEEYNRLSRIIDSLLFLARADSTEIKINPVRIDIRKEIEAVAEFHEAVAKEQGVEVTCEGNTHLHTDPILFRRVISNLLTNALQYTASGGKVSLSIQKTKNHSVQIRIRDTGYGIAPEHLPRIFDRFYRADPSRSQSPQGTGLGLAIVKSIMELHQGSVTIESQPAKGTTVILQFPDNA